MTSKLKCPFCQTELEQMHDKKMFGCSKCLHIADGAFWTKAIQAKQDLEISRKALEKIVSDYEVDASNGWLAANAKQALEQIKHKEK